MRENKGKTSIFRDQGKNLMEKAEKMMVDYNHATGCGVCIYDSAYKPLFPDISWDCSPEKQICPYCTGFRPGSGDKQETFPCQEMHISAIKEANRKGGSHIYECLLGLTFWTSPIYTEGFFSGAVRGSGFLRESKKTVDISSNEDNTLVMCNSEIPNEEFKERVNSFPAADGEKVESLSEMLQVCAESLSTGNEDYHEILKRRTEQQEAIGKIITELEKQYSQSADGSGKSEKPGYPLEKEKALLAALRMGDIEETKKLLNELMAMLIFSNAGQYKYIQFRVTELVVLLSRVEINPIKGGNLSTETNSQNLKQVQDAKSIEELTDILHMIVDRISDTISSFRGIPHAAALKKAEDFILENFTRKISLKEIATVAGLSPPYFSTIFKEEMGENLSKYLNRLRVEKASRYLLETDMSLSEIASCCCFEDQSWFSKIFKAYTGISPGKYRNQGGGLIRNIGDNNLSEGFRKAVN